MKAVSHLIRVPNAIYERLQSLADESGLPMGAIVRRVIEREEERRYWVQFDAAYAAARPSSVTVYGLSRMWSRRMAPAISQTM